MSFTAAVHSSAQRLPRCSIRLTQKALPSHPPRSSLLRCPNHITCRNHDRYASSSSSSSNSKSTSNDAISLEQPDKFRPPSHPQRLKARSTTGMYGAGAAYNQGQNAREREASKTKKYPNMFPNEGTFMHWFLTNRQIHVFISLGVLATLAVFSFATTWAKTTPFAHLIPSKSLLPLHPIEYISELLSVYRLHVEYNTQRVVDARREGVLDARKRRLYRRAHGLEDLEKDEDEGPDVRGLVEWDDGLTNPERERGGVYVPVLSGGQAAQMGARPGEGMSELMKRREQEIQERSARLAKARQRKMEQAEKEEEERLVRIGAKKGDEEQPRRRKVWFGIWG